MYPIDRRKVAVHIYSFLSSLRKTAILLDVSHTTVARWLQCTERCRYKSKQRLLKSQLVVETLQTALQCDPFLSIRELTIKIKEVLKIEVSRELERIAIKRHAITKKKAKYYSVSNNQELRHKNFFTNAKSI